MQLRSTPPLSPSSEKDSGGPCHKPLCRAHYCFWLSTYALKTTVGSASKALSLPDPLGLDLANLDHVTLANKAHCGDKDLSLLSLSHMGTEKQRDHFNMSFLLQSAFSGWSFLFFSSFHACLVIDCDFLVLISGVALLIRGIIDIRHTLPAPSVSYL